jgi:tetratricopeptide (TPR) repeat protein
MYVAHSTQLLSTGTPNTSNSRCIGTPAAGTCQIAESEAAATAAAATTAGTGAQGCSGSSSLSHVRIERAIPQQHVLRAREESLLQYIRDNRAYYMPHWWYVLADTQAALQDYKQAALSYVQSAKQAQIVQRDREAAWSMYQAAAAYGKAGRQADAIATARKGLRMCKDTCGPELHWLLAFMEYSAEHYELAVENALKAATQGCFGAASNGSICSSAVCRDASMQQQQQQWRHLPAWYEAPYDVLRYAYTLLGKSAAADAAELDYRAAVAAREAAEREAPPITGVYEVQSIQQLRWNRSNIQV